MHLRSHFTSQKPTPYVRLVPFKTMVETNKCFGKSCFFLLLILGSQILVRTHTGAEFANAQSWMVFSTEGMVMSLVKV